MNNTPVRPALIQSAAGFRARDVATLFVGLMLIALVPVLTHRLPPLSDYVNHLARMHIINAIDDDPYLARFYSIDWAIIPNLMIDLVVPYLSEVMSVYTAGQAFTVFSFVLIVSGTLALNRALFGRWSPLPLIAIPLLYNGVMLVGVMNYVFGIGLALWALAGWVMFRERALVLRLALSTLFVVGLFFCHLFAVGIYGLGLLAFELQRLWEKRAGPLWPRLADFVATGIPFLVGSRRPLGSWSSRAIAWCNSETISTMRRRCSVASTRASRSKRAGPARAPRSCRAAKLAWCSARVVAAVDAIPSIWLPLRSSSMAHLGFRRWRLTPMVSTGTAITRAASSCRKCCNWVRRAICRWRNYWRATILIVTLMVVACC
jgi:hypothetical protein